MCCEVYSGDSDGICATVGTQNWIYDVTNAQLVDDWRPYYVDDQQAGYITKFSDSLTFMTVHYAGHEVPAYQPPRALELLNMYLDGSIFETSSQESSTSATPAFASIVIALAVVSAVSFFLIILANFLQETYKSNEIISFES